MDSLGRQKKFSVLNSLKLNNISETNDELADCYEPNSLKQQLPLFDALRKQLDQSSANFSVNFFFIT